MTSCMKVPKDPTSGAGASGQPHSAGREPWPRRAGERWANAAGSQPPPPPGSGLLGRLKEAEGGGVKVKVNFDFFLSKQRHTIKNTKQNLQPGPKFAPGPIFYPKLTQFSPEKKGQIFCGGQMGKYERRADSRWGQAGEYMGGG